MARPVSGNALSAAERTAKAKEALLGAGGRRMTINLGPVAAEALARLRKALKLGTDRGVIEAALLAHVTKRSKR